VWFLVPQILELGLLGALEPLAQALPHCHEDLALHVHSVDSSWSEPSSCCFQDLNISCIYHLEVQGSFHKLFSPFLQTLPEMGYRLGGLPIRSIPFPPVSHVGGFPSFPFLHLCRFRILVRVSGLLKNCLPRWNFHWPVGMRNIRRPGRGGCCKAWM